MVDNFAGLQDRHVELPVSSRDPLVVARVIAILALAAFESALDNGTATTRVALFLVAVAAIQPALPILCRSQYSYRQAQMLTDVIGIAIVVAIAPQYFGLSCVMLAGIIGNNAAFASARGFVLSTGLALTAMLVVGEARDVEQYERDVAIIAIMAAGLGFLGHRARRSLSVARGDILDALGAAGGLVHLIELSTGYVDVVGDTTKVVGWSREELLSMDHREFIHPDDLAAYWLDDSVTPGTLVDRTARMRTGDGRWIWIRDVSRVVIHEKRLHLRGFSIDVTDQQDGLRRLTTEASTDVLTGLQNRRALLVELDARKLTPHHHLVLIDLNRFKDVNDKFGHETGDALLRVVADRLASCLRPDDVLVRLGGDEFAIVLEGLRDMSAAVAAVDRMAFEVSQPVEIAGVNVTTSISAGIVDARLGEADELIMLRRADIAMYTAKRLNRVSAVFDAELERTLTRRAELSKNFSDALARGDLTLHYQPIVDTISGAIVGGEGLARWEHPVFGLLTSDEFLDVVFSSDRSAEFTQRMVLDAIDTVRILAEAGSSIAISINLPIRTLEDVEFGAWFIAACDAAAVNPNQLVFEITERGINDDESITSAIDRLAGLGVTISVDDFGAGHATFKRLRWRNVAQLKLDRSLLFDVTTDAREREVLRSILDLATRLNYNVVAAGVETDEQLALLRQLGCPQAQGFLFARAMMRPKFIEYALHGRAASTI